MNVTLVGLMIALLIAPVLYMRLHAHSRPENHSHAVQEFLAGEDRTAISARWRAFGVPSENVMYILPRTGEIGAFVERRFREARHMLGRMGAHSIRDGGANVLSSGATYAHKFGWAIKPEDASVRMYFDGALEITTYSTGVDGGGVQLPLFFDPELRIGTLLWDDAMLAYMIADRESGEHIKLDARTWDDARRELLLEYGMIISEPLAYVYEPGTAGMAGAT